VTHRRQRLPQQRLTGLVEIDGDPDNDVVAATVGAGEPGEGLLGCDLLARSVAGAALLFQP
jgi:hypothetical protein